MNTESLKKFDVMNEDTLAGIIGGAGYTWQCSDGKKSNWHLFRGTAASNALSYQATHPGVTCSVFHA